MTLFGASICHTIPNNVFNDRLLYFLYDGNMENGMACERGYLNTQLFRVFRPPRIRARGRGGLSMQPIVTEITMVCNTYHLACPLDTNIHT